MRLTLIAITTNKRYQNASRWRYAVIGRGNFATTNQLIRHSTTVGIVKRYFIGMSYTRAYAHDSREKDILGR